MKRHPLRPRSFTIARARRLKAMVIGAAFALSPILGVASLAVGQRLFDSRTSPEPGQQISLAELHEKLGRCPCIYSCPPID